MYLTKYLLFFAFICITVPLSCCQKEAVALSAFNSAIQGASVNEFIVSGISYRVTSISVYRPPTITVQETSTFIHIRLRNLGLNIYGEWKTSSIHGTFRARADDVNIYIRYRKSTKRVDRCRVNLGNISLKLTPCATCGGAASATSTINRSSFLDKLKREVRRVICRRLRRLLNGKL